MRLQHVRDRVPQHVLRRPRDNRGHQRVPNVPSVQLQRELLDLPRAGLKRAVLLPHWVVCRVGPLPNDVTSATGRESVFVGVLA
jgi:hypothetical protein